MVDDEWRGCQLIAVCAPRLPQFDRDPWSAPQEHFPSNSGQSDSGSGTDATQVFFHYEKGTSVERPNVLRLPEIAEGNPVLLIDPSHEVKQTPRSPKLLVSGVESNGNPLEVRSPWDDSVVGIVPTSGAEDTRRAIEGAHDAMSKGLPSHERAEILDRAAARLRERRQDFATILALEIGKPISQALVEVDRCIQTLIFSAVEARTLTGTGVVFDAHPAGVGRRGFTIRVPIGVVAAITPFNFPLNLAAHKLGPAIAAGCGIVLKPARQAPLAVAELVSLLYEAGLPESWLSVVVGPSAEISDVLVADPRVGMITFTGSSEVGWGLVSRAPKKKVTLELGNSTPVIVCADADLGSAAATIAGSGFSFAGQSCISVQRVIVEEPAHEEFVNRIRQETAKKKLGDPLDPETHVGPLIDVSARDRVVDWVNEAASLGAVEVAGASLSGEHLGPILLDAVSPEARVWHQEVFGPVVGIRTFKEFEDALRLANETEYGLQAGIFTANISKALEASERLKFGGVTINETPTFRVDQMPYGGTKESGNSREGPHYAVREMTEERVLVFGR